MMSTPSGERIHISFFGKRNAGKSSIVNAITGQQLSVVSDVKGTTTDPVKKAMELLPIGPVVIIDTPGFDDEGVLGQMRVEKTNEILAKTDIAILISDATTPTDNQENEFINKLKERNIPYITVLNKSDLLNTIPNNNDDCIYVSAKDNINIDVLKSTIAKKAMQKQNTKVLIGDLLESDDIVVLVTPIDESAPKGRLILPQQQTI
jgi:[FeFe] hydrogenase H-cluster maturation GTPase HydF